MKHTDLKLPKSNNWNTFKNKISKIGKFGYPLAISTVLLLSSCGNKDSEITKKAKEFDNTIENVATAKENLKNKEEALKEAQEELQKARQELIDAEKKEQETKEKLKQEGNKL